ANEALRLQPDLPEAHLALGFSYYYGDRDYERALAEFEVAKRGLPNEAQAYMAIGAIQRRQGKWAESTANLEKAAELDPKNGSVLLNLAYTIWPHEILKLPIRPLTAESELRRSRSA